MKTTQTLLGKYHNPITKESYLVLEIKDFDRVVNLHDNSEKRLVRHRYETINGMRLQRVGGLAQPKFRIDNTDMVIEAMAWH